MKILFIILSFLFPSAHALIVDSSVIQTSLLRKDVIQTYLSRINFTSQTNLLITDTTANKDIRGQLFTKTEYDSIKQGIINKMRNNGFKNLDTDEQVFAWIDILNKECAGKKLSAVPTISSLNNLLEKGC